MKKAIKYLKKIDKKLTELAWDLLDNDELFELSDEEQDELCVIYHELQSAKHKIILLWRKNERKHTG